MKKHFNYFLFFLVAALVSFGFLFLVCLSSTSSLKRFGNTDYYWLHQLAGLGLAIGFGFLGYKIPISFFKKWALPAVLVNLLALFLVFIPQLGGALGGASRWFHVGGFTIQPSEFLKITSILYLSAWIASKLSETRASDFKSFAQKSWHNLIYIFIPFAVFLGMIFIGLYLQSDASTLGITTITLLALYFSSKTPLWHTLVIVITGIGTLLLMVISEPYRLERWLTFLHPDTDPLGKGLQIRQSLISLGSGGIFGKGLGMSTIKGQLPMAMSDSIFAIFGEELGIVGCLVLIGAFLFLLYLGIKIAKESNDKFSRMVATGIVVWITLQAFINMASAAGIFPLAGIPLPFFSYGGSHLAVEIFSIGLLLNIAKNT